MTTNFVMMSWIVISCSNWKNAILNPNIQNPFIYNFKKKCLDLKPQTHRIQTNGLWKFYSPWKNKKISLILIKLINRVFYFKIWTKKSLLKLKIPINRVFPKIKTKWRKKHKFKLTIHLKAKYPYYYLKRLKIFPPWNLKRSTDPFLKTNR